MKMENTFIQRFTDWQVTTVSVKKVQVINQSDSLAEDVFGRTIDMVDRKYHWILLFLIFLSLHSRLLSSQSAAFGCFSLFEPDAPQLVFPTVCFLKEDFFPSLLILEICCPERMTGRCQWSAHVRQKSVDARAPHPSNNSYSIPTHIRTQSFSPSLLPSTSSLNILSLH